MPSSFKTTALDAARAARFPDSVGNVAIDSGERRRHPGAMSMPLFSSPIVSRTAAATSYYAYASSRAGPG